MKGVSIKDEKDFHAGHLGMMSTTNSIETFKIDSGILQRAPQQIVRALYLKNNIFLRVKGLSMKVKII